MTSQTASAADSLPLPELLARLARESVRLRLEGQTVLASPARAARPLFPALQRHKPALVALLKMGEGSLSARELGLLGKALSGQLYLPLDVPSSPTPRLRECPPVRLVQDPTELPALFDALSREEVLGFDTETTGLDPRSAQVRLVCLATPNQVVVIDAFKVPLVDLAPLMGLEGPLLSGHNLRFDLGFFLLQGIWRGNGERLWDTALADQVLRGAERMPSLRSLVPELDKTLQTSDWSGPLSQEQIRYAALDAHAVRELYLRQKAEIEREGLEGVNLLERRALPAMTWLELTGVPLDLQVWNQTLERLSREIAALQQQLPQGVNWNSAQQALEYLREQGLAVEDTRSETLLEYAHHPLVDLLLRYRERSRQRSRCPEGKDEWRHPLTGRVHPRWWQIGNRRGEPVSDRPDLAALWASPPLWESLRAREGGVLLRIWIEQEEARILAALTGEPLLAEGFAHGEDAYRRLAARLLGRPEDLISEEDRSLAQVLLSCFPYGLQPAHLRSQAASRFRIFLTPEAAFQLSDALRAVAPTLCGYLERGGKESPRRSLSGRRGGDLEPLESCAFPYFASRADGIKAALAALWESREKLQGATPLWVKGGEILLEAPSANAEEILQRAQGRVAAGFAEVFKDELPVPVGGEIWRRGPAGGGPP